MISMNFPSRGLCESATTIRYAGDFFRPTRRSLILTICNAPCICGLVILRAHRSAGVSGKHPILQKAFVMRVSRGVWRLAVLFAVFYRPPNIPGIPGIPNLPPPPWDIFFIIFCISRN